MRYKNCVELNTNYLTNILFKFLINKLNKVVNLKKELNYGDNEENIHYQKIYCKIDERAGNYALYGIRFRK